MHRLKKEENYKRKQQRDVHEGKARRRKTTETAIGKKRRPTLFNKNAVETVREKNCVDFLRGINGSLGNETAATPRREIIKLSPVPI